MALRGWPRHPPSRLVGELSAAGRRPCNAIGADTAFNNIQVGEACDGWAHGRGGGGGGACAIKCGKSHARDQPNRTNKPQALSLTARAEDPSSCTRQCGGYGAMTTITHKARHTTTRSVRPSVPPSIPAPPLWHGAALQHRLPQRVRQRAGTRRCHHTRLDCTPVPATASAAGLRRGPATAHRAVETLPVCRTGSGAGTTPCLLIDAHR